MNLLEQITDDLVQFARLALTARPQDIQLFLRRMSRRYQEPLPKLAEGLSTVLRDSPTRSSPLRRENAVAIPVDVDSRMQLVRVEEVPVLPVEPIFRAPIREALEQLILEREGTEELFKAGLSPTKSILFTGPPGVGKTLAARWIASQLKLPLLILDLAAVMSSFLGRTGNNLRYVLDYAKGVPCVLLLDEFDSIAKRRDDSGEVGELKRLVTVLLQEIDDWPVSGILIAATNHSELLDPAVWRRFELKLEFPLPNREEIQSAILSSIAELKDKRPLMEALTSLFEGESFSDIERQLLLLRRSAALKREPINELLKALIRNSVHALPRKNRGDIAKRLVESGIASQREAHDLTGVSRDTIRKMSSVNGESAREAKHAKSS